MLTSRTIGVLSQAHFPGVTDLAGPLWDEEGILTAELDPQRLYEERQRFDPAGHYHRPDVLRLERL